ncbi:MAG: transglutaminase-like domain-containing protein [Candidatus Omnitrophota bacterium]
MKNSTQYDKILKQAAKTVSSLIIAILAQILLFNVQNSFSLDNGVLGSMVISQERIVTGGVLISRPALIDEKIRDIVVFNNIRTLDDYVSWVKSNIEYRRDENGDTWSTPDETLNAQGGDCEDFAFFNSAALRVLGFNPEVLAILRIGRSHAICAFKENGTYSLIDNKTLIRTKAATMAELAVVLQDMYNFSTLCSVRYENKKLLVLYKKSDIVSKNS